MLVGIREVSWRVSIVIFLTSIGPFLQKELDSCAIPIRRREVQHRRRVSRRQRVDRNLAFGDGFA